MIGATSGIGNAMAERIVQSGSKVIVVGRRQERLDSFVSKHGKENASALAFDITDTVGLPHFVKTVTGTHPDLE
jgi:NADP-dependent 3-hydroxy acid dehydrogenase YdfG